MKKTLSLLLAVFTLVFCFSACVSAPTEAPAGTTTAAPETDPPAQQEALTVRTIALKGPTGMGLVSLMEKNEAGSAQNTYQFSLLSSPDDATAEIIKGDYDIAALPTNLASVLYQKTEEELEVIALNTLGTLYILENGNTVNSISDLNGKTLYATGQGAVPEYVLNYILQKNNVTCTIEYLSEHSELAAQMADGAVTLGMLPEPNVTSALKQNAGLRVALDLTGEWNKISDGELVMGCLVVRRAFAQEHPEALSVFLSEYAESVSYVNTSAPEAAKLIERYGIIPKAAVAEAAIPNCNMVCVTGEEMKATLNAFYEVLYTANPKSVGGSLPNDDFFYLEK